MEEFKNFYIKEFEIEDSIVHFTFSFDEKIYFQESIDFWIKVDTNIDNLLTNLSIALWISYFKLYPFANFNFPVNLSKEQLNFWMKFYINWLWEFFYTNNIDPNIHFINWKNNFKKYKVNIESYKALLLWWWGKDSIVSYSFIKNRYDFTPFVVWKLDKIKKDTIKITWKKEILVKRQIDPKLFEYNKTYYNGHVPITWIISFISLISAKLYNYGYIFTSNEKSAWEENTTWKWIKINHQYSKSKEFEDDFNDYNKNFIEWVTYKSLLSNLYEIDIAKYFSKLEEFFPYFSSCNRNFTISKSGISKRWCGECEKCAFVYLILSPYIEQEKLEKIFGKNLFEDENLLWIYKKLIWKENIKPFECVWTYKESAKALKEVLKKYEWKKLPHILKKTTFLTLNK